MKEHFRRQKWYNKIIKSVSKYIKISKLFSVIWDYFLQNFPILVLSFVCLPWTRNKQWDALMEIFPWNGSLKKQATCRLLYKIFEEYFLWNLSFSFNWHNATLQQYLSESTQRVSADSHYFCQSSLMSTLC